MTEDNIINTKDAEIVIVEFDENESNEIRMKKAKKSWKDFIKNLLGGKNE